MKGPRRARMPVYGAGSKYLGRTEKETEWLRFLRAGASRQFPLRPYTSTQVLLQTGRLKIARSLPHAALLARELVNFRFKVGQERTENALDWREGPDDDLVLALAIAAWEAERNPGLGFSCSYAVSEFDGRPGL